MVLYSNEERGTESNKERWFPFSLSCSYFSLVSCFHWNFPPLYIVLLLGTCTHTPHHITSQHTILLLHIPSPFSLSLSLSLLCCFFHFFLWNNYHTTQQNKTTITNNTITTTTITTYNIQNTLYYSRPCCFFFSPFYWITITIIITIIQTQYIRQCMCTGDKIISASRCIFFSVLFVAAAVLATVAYLLYREEETQNFERSVRCLWRDVVGCLLVVLVGCCIYSVLLLLFVCWLWWESGIVVVVVVVIVVVIVFASILFCCHYILSYDILCFGSPVHPVSPTMTTYYIIPLSATNNRVEVPARTNRKKI